MTAHPVDGIFGIFVDCLWFESQYISSFLQFHKTGITFVVSFQVLDFVSSKARKMVIFSIATNNTWPVMALRDLVFTPIILY
jgi:hypothetical protein